ncbi:MAG: cell division protein FtsQ/DivIB [Acidimicrobiales bacterium]
MTPATRTPSAGSRSIDPRIRQRRLSVHRSRVRRRLRWTLAALVTVAVLVGVVAVLHTPPFSARVVTVTGAHPRTSDAAIVDAAGLSHHPALISVDPGATAARVEALPFIAAARVRRHWPDGVEIAVTERVPAVQMAGPGASWSVLDAAGRTLEITPAPVPGLRTLVVRTPTGVVAPAPVGGSLAPAAGGGLLVARTLPTAFSAQVDSITVAPDGTTSLVVDSGITVLLGPATDLTAKYEDVSSIIAHGALRATSTIDVTVPQSPTVGG